MSLHASIDTTVAQLSAAAGAQAPRIAVILGSGWQDFAQQVESPVSIPYAQLPAFPEIGVEGHAGKLLVGKLGGNSVAVLCGRKHAYETGRADAMKGAIRSLAQWGCQVLVQTNAAGSLDTAMRPGSVMLITDHLNMTQLSPLVGEEGSQRFVDMADAYGAALRAQALQIAKEAGAHLHQGVYAWVLGPQFETPAEIRMLQRAGAQAVGMSSVPETILARHAGMRVLALSLMTNMGSGLDDEKLSHAHTLARASEASARAVPLLKTIVAGLTP
ncbi:MAG: purine-nucleoside phosphorylase [Burkholderiaceae bacterium]